MKKYKQEALVQESDKRKSKNSERSNVPILLSPPQISHRLAWD
jgi:hypothetical protein